MSKFLKCSTATNALFRNVDIRLAADTE